MIINLESLLSDKDLIIAQLTKDLEHEWKFNSKVSGSLSSQKQVLQIAKELQEEALKDKNEFSDKIKQLE